MPRCPNCGSTKYYVLDLNPFCILRCRSCGASWEHEQPGEEDR